MDTDKKPTFLEALHAFVAVIKENRLAVRGELYVSKTVMQSILDAGGNTKGVVIAYDPNLDAMESDRQDRLAATKPFSWYAGYNQHKGTTEKELLDARAKKSEGEKEAEQEMNAFIEKHKTVAAADYKEAVARIEAEIEKQLGGSITFFYNESVGVGFHLAGVGKNVIISPLEVIQNCDSPERIANLVKARLCTAEKTAANERSKMVKEHMPKSLELLASLPENEGRSIDDIANALTGGPHGAEAHPDLAKLLAALDAGEVSDELMKELDVYVDDNFALLPKDLYSQFFEACRDGRIEKNNTRGDSFIHLPGFKRGLSYKNFWVLYSPDGSRNAGSVKEITAYYGEEANTQTA